MGRAQEALDLQQQALRIRTELLGPDHPETIMSYLNVASAIAEADGNPPRTKEAEALIRRALEAQRRTFGPDSPESATALHNLALNLMEQGRMAEAEQLLVASIAALERARGTSHPSLSSAQLNLGTLFERTGWYAEAEARYRDALGGRLRAFDRASVPVASVMGRLGSVILAQGRAAEAIPLLREAADVQRARPDGRGAPAQLLYDLGRAYFDADRSAEAIAPLREALEASRRTASGAYANEANVVVALCASLMELQRFDEALAAVDGLRRLASAQGDEGEEVVAAMDLARATILRRLGRYDEASRAAAACARMRLRRFGAEAPPTLQSLAVLGVVRAEAGDTTSAIGLLSSVWLTQSLRPAGAAAPESLALRSLAAAVARHAALDGRTRQQVQCAIGERLAELAASMPTVTRRAATEELLGAQRVAVEAMGSLGQRGLADAKRELLRAVALTDALDLPTTHTVRVSFLAPQIQALGAAPEAVLIRPQRHLWSGGSIPTAAEVAALLDAAAPPAEWARGPARASGLPRLLAPLAFGHAAIEALLPALASGEAPAPEP
jgi:tetratricopeptide (TPR) repeat protein